MWCDGRRSWPLPPGSRIEVTRSAEPVRLARMHASPFSARLVSKFELPIQGWRGPVPETANAKTASLPVVPLPAAARAEPGRTIP
jgi:NAD+ kinase